MTKNQIRKDKIENIFYLEYIRDMKTTKVFNEYTSKKKKIILDYCKKIGVGTQIEWCYNATKLENLAYQLYLEDNNYEHVFTQSGLIDFRFNINLYFEKYFKEANEKIRKDKLTILDKYND